MSTINHYRFLIENPADADECTRYAPGYPNIGGSGASEAEARQRVLDEADEDAESLQTKLGERLGPCVQVNDRWLIQR